MTRAILSLTATFFIGLMSFAQTPTSKANKEKFSAETVKTTIDELQKELSEKHPGFYRYTTETQFTAYIDSIKKTITDSLTLFGSFQKLKPIVAKINCLHTGISLPKAYLDQLNTRPNLFPFQLFFSENKAYVVRNFSDNNHILPGDEILSINGKSIPEITALLFALIPSDGYNQTLKYRALNLQFPSWYRNIDLTENFSILVNRNTMEKTYYISGAKFDDIAKDGFLKEPTRPKQLEFKIENNVAFLTIHSFAKTDIKNAKQDFKKFTDQAFEEIKNKNIENLIVDLRDNTGGSDPNAEYFTSYFFDQPFRYWDRIEVTETVAKEIKGLSLKLFYRKPIEKKGIWLWQKAKHTSEFDYYETQKPAKNNYSGKTYILINGFCMSSCADVAAILSHNKKAIFIGQETGGGYQGNNSGMLPVSLVQPFGFTLTVPLQKYTNAVNPLVNYGHGTMPDYKTEPNSDSILNHNDKEMQRALDLIFGAESVHQ
ncbi:S41 family peptidase [Flavobacterium notoginsengisoli]|uniref:S41 family peptidase n=1 Tax=Flavobacterium notoginsengisoli TaxID=1478199 RepID=UPI003628B1D8